MPAPSHPPPRHMPDHTILRIRLDLRLPALGGVAVLGVLAPARRPVGRPLPVDLPLVPTRHDAPPVNVMGWDGMEGPAWLSCPARAPYLLPVWCKCVWSMRVDVIRAVVVGGGAFCSGSFLAPRRQLLTARCPRSILAWPKRPTSKRASTHPNVRNGRQWLMDWCVERVWPGVRARID